MVFCSEVPIDFSKDTLLMLLISVVFRGKMALKGLLKGMI